MERELEKFLNVSIPNKGYHAPNGDIELFSEKRLSFQCGCGASHSVLDSEAIIDFPMENKGVYICPDDKPFFSLVKATGILSIKGLKTIATYEAINENEIYQIMSTLESRKKRG